MSYTIIGGGISGLTTAHTLLKQGLSCQIFEKTKQLSEIGAGILLQPNALKVFDSIGLGNTIREAGQTLEQAIICSEQLKPVRKAGKNLLTDRNGMQITGIHRARLQGILADTLPDHIIHFGQTYDFHAETESGVKVHLSDYVTESKGLIGADGIHSALRNRVIPHSEIRYSGQTCWRGISTMELPTTFKNASFEAWGQKLRFGMAPISPTETYWFAVQSEKARGKDDKETLHADLLKRFASFAPIVQDLIKSTPQELIIRNDIIDLKRIKSWSHSKVGLIGDAAHATTPNLGQGAAQGIEDAFYLSQFLKKYDSFEMAFKQFELFRRPKVDEIVQTSWRIGKWSHNKLIQPLLKLAISSMPEAKLHQQMQNIYDLKSANI